MSSKKILSTFDPPSSVTTSSPEFKSYTERSSVLTFYFNFLASVDRHPTSMPLLFLNSTTFFLPNATYHSADGRTYGGAEDIWDWINQIIAPFEHLTHDITSVIEIEESVGGSGTTEAKKWHIHVHGTRILKLHSWESKRSIPFHSVFTIEERTGAQRNDEKYGISAARMYWDMSIMLMKRSVKGTDPAEG